METDPGKEIVREAVPVVDTPEMLPIPGEDMPEILPVANCDID